MLCRLVLSTPCCVIGLIALGAGCAMPKDVEDDPSGSGARAGAPGGAAGRGGSVGLPGGSPGLGGVPSVGGAPSTGGSSSGAPSTGGSPVIGGAGSGSGGASSGSGGASLGGASSGCSKTLPCREDFEDGRADEWFADSDTDTDDDTVGNWAIVADGASRVYAQQTEYSDDSWAVGGNVSWTDQRAEVKVKFVSIPDDSAMVYLAVRFRDARNYYFMYLRADGSLRVRKRFDGSTTDVVPTRQTGVVPSVGTWYTLALEARGSTLTAFLNGMMMGSAMDSSIANGGIGVGVVDALASFDDVTVSAP